MNGFLNARQLAELLGYTEQTINKYAQIGKIPKPIKLLGKKLWRKEEIEKWIEERTKEVGGENAKFVR